MKKNPKIEKLLELYWALQDEANKVTEAEVMAELEASSEDTYIKNGLKWGATEAENYNMQIYVMLEAFGYMEKSNSECKGIYLKD